MDRRSFLKLNTRPILNFFRDLSIDSNFDAADPFASHNVIGSYPALQNYASTSVGVAFKVKDSIRTTKDMYANGYVKIWKEGEDEANARQVMCGGYRTTGMNDLAILIRVTDLEPSTTYNYKIYGNQIEYKSSTNTRIVGELDQLGPFQFTTAGENSSSHFCVINDLHNDNKTIPKLGYMMTEVLKPDFVLLNGDVANREENITSIVTVYIVSKFGDYAGVYATRPYLFCPGNHDQRGKAIRQIHKACMYRQPEERKPRDWDLGRNFAVRSGDIAIIGMDTGEDRRDSTKIFPDLLNNEPYREAQKIWLEDALEQPEIKNAPFLICACHIPLMDTNPRMNGGDVDGENPDVDKYKFTHDSADWLKTCAKLWLPALEKHGCQLIISAHTHLYKYNAPTALRPWACINGGGSTLTDPVEYATIIDIKVENNKLVIRTYNLHGEENEKYKIVETHYIEPRKF